MRVAALLAAALFAASNPGLTPRPAPSDYPSHGADGALSVGAEVLDDDNVANLFATDLRNYYVIEVAVYPGKQPLDVSAVDFALRMDGRTVRAAAPASIAAINQKKGQSRRDDIALYPNVGVHTGTWGTGVGVGVGAGVGGRRGPRGPASTDKDREVMERELEDRGLHDGAAAKPVAGYLYFPRGKTPPKTMELEYMPPERDRVVVTLPAPRKK